MRAQGAQLSIPKTRTGGMGGSGGRGACALTAESHCCTEETSTTLETEHPPMKGLRLLDRNYEKSKTKIYLQMEEHVSLLTGQFNTVQCYYSSK